MSYYLYDSRGFVADGPSIQGWEDFVRWVESEPAVDHVDEFIETGSVENLSAFIDELSTTMALGSVERTRRAILEAARKAEDILILSNGVGEEEDIRTAGGRGSGNFGHAGRPGQVGGSADRNLSPEEVTNRVLHLQAYGSLLSSNYNPERELRFQGIRPEDRVAMLVEANRLRGESSPLRIRGDRYNYDHPGKGAYQFLAFQRQAENERWDAQRVFDEGIKQGLATLDPEAEGFVAIPRQTFVGRNPRFLEGMDSDERNRYEDAYIKSLGGLTDNAESTNDLTSLLRNGWTNEDLERFADKAVAAGASIDKEYSEYTNVDSLHRSLSFYTRDYSTFRAELFRGWSAAGGTATAITARAVAEQAFPLQNGKFYRPEDNETLYSASFDGFKPSEAFSPRAVEHMRALKAETEAYYRQKLKTDDLKSKPLETIRAVGNKVEAYTPGSIESWTTDKPTVARFGKMMSKGFTRYEKGVYSKLTAQVTYDDVLWSWQSVKGQRGWPEEKQLKGKKEFVLIGSRVKKVGAEHVYL
jgi:hypothetical protein